MTLPPMRDPNPTQPNPTHAAMTELVEPIDGEAGTEAAPPPAIPVFEPWGSRPPPRYFGSS